MTGSISRFAAAREAELSDRKSSTPPFPILFLSMALVCVFVDTTSGQKPLVGRFDLPGYSNKPLTEKEMRKGEEVFLHGNHANKEAAFETVQAYAKENDHSVSAITIAGVIGNVRAKFTFDDTGNMLARVSGTFESENTARKFVMEIARELKIAVDCVIVDGAIARDGQPISCTFGFDEQGALNASCVGTYWSASEAAMAARGLATALGTPVTQVKVMGKIGNASGTFGFGTKGAVASALLSGPNCSNEREVRAAMALSAGGLKIPVSGVTVKGSINGNRGVFILNKAGDVVGTFESSMGVTDKNSQKAEISRLARSTGLQEENIHIQWKQHDGGVRRRSGKTRQEEYRTWTDDTGQFKIEAVFVGCAFGKVKLRKKDGEKITVPLTRLSRQDQKRIAERRK